MTIDKILENCECPYCTQRRRIAELEAKNAALNAENERLRDQVRIRAGQVLDYAKDAERYRWLRNEALYAGYGYKKALPWAVMGTSHLDCHPVSGEELDSAIDAERAAK